MAGVPITVSVLVSARHDGERDGPPGGTASAQEVVFQTSLVFPELCAKPGNKKQIRSNYREVSNMHGQRMITCKCGMPSTLADGNKFETARI